MNDNTDNNQQQQALNGLRPYANLPERQWCMWHQRWVRHDSEQCEWGVQQRTLGHLAGQFLPPRPNRNSGAGAAAAMAIQGIIAITEMVVDSRGANRRAVQQLGLAAMTAIADQLTDPMGSALSNGALPSHQAPSVRGRGRGRGRSSRGRGGSTT